MKLSELKETIDKLLRKQKKGKHLKAKKVRKILGKLETREGKYEKGYAKESSTKARKKLELKRRVVKAQIKKARKILDDLDA